MITWHIDEKLDSISMAMKTELGIVCVTVWYKRIIAIDYSYHIARHTRNAFYVCRRIISQWCASCKYNTIKFQS